MAPSQLPTERKTVGTTVAKFENYGRPTSAVWGDYPSGVLQLLDATTDNKLTNPRNNGLGYVMDVAIELARQNGTPPTREELRDAYLGQTVEIDGEKALAGDHLWAVAQEQARQVHEVAAFTMGVTDPEAGDFDETLGLVWDYARDKLFRQTAEAADGEWKAVGVFKERYADAGTRALRTDAELHNAGLGGESAGIDAAIEVDGEWVTLQVKPAGMPDSKGNADFVLEYEANARIAGEMKIVAEPNE